MFKVECLGCQAPYQVDERRVPEKGLKMRCPKCGTSFKVEAPGGSAAAGDSASAAVSDLPAPALAHAGFEPSRAPLGRGAGSPRDALARTMIGVAGAAGADASKAKAFRMPRPAGSEPAAGTGVALAELSHTDTVIVAGTEPPSELDADMGAGLALREEAELPAVPNRAARAPAGLGVARAPTAPSELDHFDLEAAPESLADPSTPLSLSELPQPVAAPRRAAPTRAPVVEPEGGLALDYGEDLPAAASAQKARRPPPRRARAAAEPIAAPARESADLPARLEDLDRSARAPVAVEPRVAPSMQRAPAPRTSSLDEVGLPAVVSKAAGAPLPARRSPATSTAEDLPSPARAPRAMDDDLDVDLPAVGRGAPPQRPQRAPARPADDLPDVFAARAPVAPAAGLPDVVRGDLPDVVHGDLPDVVRGDLPDVAFGDLPDVAFGDLPDVAFGDLPDVFSAGLPDVSGTGLPEVVAAGLPEVSGTGLPDVLSAGLPSVSSTGLPALTDTGLPEVSAWGARGFGRVDLPTAREAGLPVPREAGLPVHREAGLPVHREAGLPEVRGLEMDLPGVGESLPSLRDGFEFDEALLPVVGEVLPTAKGGRGLQRRLSADDDSSLSFGPDNGDPFAGAGADFGALDGLDDPFGEPVPDSGLLRDEDPASSRGAGGYGELDFAGDSGGAALETADDREFRAIPERGSAPPARAAASATVHNDAGDAEATGSTLELGPKRQPHQRTRRMLAVGVVCAVAVAGGALALKPALGPFGIHFILDQVHRGEHEKLLGALIERERQSTGLDTFKTAEAILAELETARRTLPRFAPLQARSAYAHYAVARRFGPLPALEAAAKAALDGLDPASSAPAHRLARAVSAALDQPNVGKSDLEALGSEPEAREMLADLALNARDWAGARKLWLALSQAEPKSARALFGLARAELGAGNGERAAELSRQVLALSPDHVGAVIMRLEAERETLSASPKAPGQTREALLQAVNATLPKASPGEAALAHVVIGELHLSQGRASPAQRAFEEALGINRNFPRALLGLGETLHRASRHGEALARFEAADKAEPNTLAAQLGMAKSQLHLQHLPEAKAVLTKLEAKYKAHAERIYWLARVEQAMGAHEAALGSYRASIESAKGRPDSLDAYLALAKLQAELGQLAVAQQTLTEAREKLPPSGALHKAFGEIAMNRTEYAVAHEHFQKALALDSGDTRARFLGAVALARLGRFDAALAAFQTVSETDKDFPGLAVERGRLFEDSGRIAEALAEYELALVATPEDADLQIRVGCSRVVAGKGRDAVDMLEKVTKARPRSAELSYCLGRAFFEDDRYIDAILRLERAVSLDPTRAMYHLYVGWVANEVGRHGDAETSLKHALELDKGLADAYWQRGRLLLKQGAVKDAVRDLERALELKPTRGEARADLAVAYSDLGSTGKAIQAWEDALARDPDNATWHFRYGKLLSAIGKGAEAAAHLRRAIDIGGAPEVAPPGRRKVPPWLWQAHYILARELGSVSASAAHWQAYLRLSPKDDPYRREAEGALVALGQPWDPH